MRRAVGVLGELALTIGVIVALFVGYEIVWTGVRTAQVQDQLRQELRGTERRPVQGDADPSRAPGLGRALATLRVPRLGADWHWVVVEGVRTTDLRRGPGHYPGTALPGGIGNFVVAGHRATYGEPFAHLDRLRGGDPIVVEQAGRRFVYRVRGSEIVTPMETDVILPVPKRPGARPREAVLTLTTCDPRWGSSRRLIVYAALEKPENVEKR